MSESATPRTDKEEEKWVKLNCYESYGWAFARTLERELADCRAELAQAKALLQPGQADAAIQGIRRLTERAEKAERELERAKENHRQASENAQMHYSMSAEWANRARKAESHLASHADIRGPQDGGYPFASPAGPDALAEPSFQEWWDSCGYSLEGFKPARAAWNRIAEFYRSRPAQGDSRDAVIEECARAAEPLRYHPELIPVAIRALKSDAAMSQQEPR